MIGCDRGKLSKVVEKAGIDRENVSQLTFRSHNRDETNEFLRQIITVWASLFFVHWIKMFWGDRACVWPRSDLYAEP
jgi:hypothetical protein